jgi:hypothetical protein
MATIIETEKTEALLEKTDWHPGFVEGTLTFPTYPKNVIPEGKMPMGIRMAIRTGTTIRFFGSHGTGKSAIVLFYVQSIAASEGYGDDVIAVHIPAATLGMDDMIGTGVIRQPDGSFVLNELYLEKLMPGKKFVLVIDDSLMAPQAVQNQLMQLSASWKVGNLDLREQGCIGIIFLDNPSLDEANSVMDDLAQADRFITMEVNDQDTANDVMFYLAGKYPDIDLKPAFAAREALPPSLRYIVSWRTFDQMIEVMRGGFPGHMALPYMDGSYKWLTVTDSNGNTVDRTKEFVSKVAAAVGVPYTERLNDVARKAITASIENNWALRLIGPHGVGKTDLVHAICEQMGVSVVDWDASKKDPDSASISMPTPEGIFKVILEANLSAPGRKALFIDEASRCPDLNMKARTNELIHEWSQAGVPVTDLCAVITAENPPEFLGRKYDVSQGTIAHADRFELTVVLTADDVPFYEWLQNELPAKLAKRNPTYFGNKVDEVAKVAQIVCEWHRNDIDNDGRAWVSPRNLERIIVAYVSGVPLEDTKIWLGPGERAPVPLSQLEARLAGRPMMGLREIAANIDEWETKIANSSEESSEGLAEVDVVHIAFVNADTQALWENVESVVRIVKHMPPRFRVTYFHSDDPERQKFWMSAVGAAAGRIKIADLVKERDARSK